MSDLHHALGFDDKDACPSILSWRIYRNNGKPNDTPTARVAKTGIQLARMDNLRPSDAIKTNNTSAETMASNPKNAPIRVENSSETKSDRFNP